MTERQLRAIVSSAVREAVDELLARGYIRLQEPAARAPRDVEKEGDR